MQLTIPSRRHVLLGTAAAAALLPMKQALAQTAASGGDWLAMIKTHHAMVATTFERMLASGNTTFERRNNMQRTLAYQLSAHSLAEENTVYPALASGGMVSESDKLYLDQAHAKVMNAQLEMTNVREEAAWMERVRALQAAVLKHAKEDEEANLYPKLQQSLDRARNAALTAAYTREFASVRPQR